MTRTFLVPIAFAAFLVGCVSAPPPAGIDIDPGPRPTPEQASAAIDLHLRETLRDYPSLRDLQVVDGPKRITWTRPPNAIQPFGAGWLYCIRYNAKNAYGGFTGLQGDKVVLRVEAGEAGPVRTVNWAAASGGC